MKRTVIECDICGDDIVCMDGVLEVKAMMDSVITEKGETTMREILFRGKRTDNGKWVYGCLDFNKDKSLVFIRTPSNLYTDVNMVFLATVGQYTGLTDKNGKKIFEGDIIESKFTKKPYLVCFGEYTYTDEYEEEQSACGWYNKDGNGYVTALGCPDAWATVIGNIYDNPELLEG